jgi:hypothetical protein
MGFAPLNQCGPSLAAQIGKAQFLSAKSCVTSRSVVPAFF